MSYYNIYLRLSLTNLVFFFFSVGCRENTTGGHQEESENEEREQEQKYITKGPDYPDEYRKWADCAFRGLRCPYKLHDHSCIDYGQWFYNFSTDIAYGRMVRVGNMIRRLQDLVY